MLRLSTSTYLFFEVVTGVGINCWWNYYYWCCNCIFISVDGSGLVGVASTDNIITGTAATFKKVVKVGTAITIDATSGIITATSFSGNGSSLTGVDSFDWRSNSLF